MQAKKPHPYRVAHVVDWERGGQAFFVLLRDGAIVAREAYRAALAS